MGEGGDGWKRLSGGGCRLANNSDEILEENILETISTISGQLHQSILCFLKFTLWPYLEQSV